MELNIRNVARVMFSTPMETMTDVRRLTIQTTTGEHVSLLLFDYARDNIDHVTYWEAMDANTPLRQNPNE